MIYTQCFICIFYFFLAVVWAISRIPG